MRRSFGRRDKGFLRVTFCHEEERKDSSSQSKSMYDDKSSYNDVYRLIDCGK